MPTPIFIYLRNLISMRIYPVHIHIYIQKYDETILFFRMTNFIFGNCNCWEIYTCIFTKDNLDKYIRIYIYI